MKNFVRLTALVVGLLQFVFAIGLLANASWAVGLWIWPEAPRLNIVFVSSIAAAIAAPVLWIGVTGNLGAIRGGALNLTLVCLGASSLLLRDAGFASNPRIQTYAYFSLVGVAVCAFLYYCSRRFPLLDGTETPPLVRWSFLGFSLTLVLVGTALVRAAPHVFPWPLKPAHSALYGWFFLGAAVYFAHGVLWPGWRNARGQLLGFLAYDLVLIGPYLVHLGRVQPQHKLSRFVYLLVITYSAGLAVWFLFLNPSTRLGRVSPA